MSAKIKPRPALRPAGNVTLVHQDSRKPAKKPPASPPLKPSPVRPVKISPPNSLPSTPRASLSRNPAPIKPVSSPQLAHTKLSTPPAALNACLDPIHPCASAMEPHASFLSPSLPAVPSSLEDIVGSAHGLCNEAQSCCASVDSTSEVNSLASIDSTHINSCNSSLGISNTGRSGSSDLTPTIPPKTLNCRSRLSRSSSDNFQRCSMHRSKTNGSNSGSRGFVNLNFHSLDDVSLAQLAAAKKAAASELSAQRKLKVSEYGRKPSNAIRVTPEVPSLSSAIAEPQRCKFITAQSDPLYVAYHDEEWGVPVHDDRSLFELLVLAGAQVELSWTTILLKRELYRNVFCGYDPAIVASFNEKHIRSLEANKTLLLQSAKIRGVVENARRVLEVVKEFGSLDTYLWSFLNYKPMINHYRYPKQLPAKTSKAEFISKDLVRRGFRFVGPTIVYSLMQCAGMTNDHLVQCFRHKACMHENHSSSHDANEGKLENHLGVSELDVGNIHADPIDSEPCLHELELQAQHLSPPFNHSEFVHIEAY